MTSILAIATNDTQLSTLSNTTSRNPVVVYLASLSESSRRPMLQSLEVIASLISQGTVDAMSTPWDKLRYEHTQAIRSKLADSYSASTANRHLSALRGVLKECWRLGYVSADDYQRAIDLKAIRGQKANQAEKGRHVKTGEFSALIANCMDGTVSGARDACLIILAYTCGMRRSEIAALTLEDIDLGELNITVKNGKGNKERVIPIADSTHDVLADWLKVRGEQPGFLFTRIRRGDNLTMDGLTGQAVYVILRERAELAGVKVFSPHDLRRTFIGDLLDAGVDISTAAKLAGHEKIDTTAGYDRRDARAKRKAVQALHVPYSRQYR